MAILGSAGYSRIADVLRMARSMSPASERKGVERVTRMLALTFQRDNKRFDPERFYNEVGLTTRTRSYVGVNHSKEIRNGETQSRNMREKMQREAHRRVPFLHAKLCPRWA